MYVKLTDDFWLHALEETGLYLLGAGGIFPETSQLPPPKVFSEKNPDLI